MGWLEALINEGFKSFPDLMQNPISLYVFSMVFILIVLGLALFKAFEKSEGRGD